MLVHTSLEQTIRVPRIDQHLILIKAGRQLAHIVRPQCRCNKKYYQQNYNGIARDRYMQRFLRFR